MGGSGSRDEETNDTSATNLTIKMLQSLWVFTIQLVSGKPQQVKRNISRVFETGNNIEERARHRSLSTKVKPNNNWLQLEKG